jgi:hypothetical protein
MEPLSIPLGDPRVQRMLSLDSGKSIVQIAGDAPDPTGITAHRGALSTTRLTAGKEEVIVVFGDLLMTVDIYAIAGEPTKVHLYCPRCHKLLTVSQERKAIEYDAAAPNPACARVRAMGVPPQVWQQAAQGRLSIEAFSCPWEVGDAPHVAGALHTGVSLCRQRLVIDNNLARDPSVRQGR